MSEADVRLRGVRKAFGGVTAVDGVSLDVRAGEFFSLLGPSGCGKTTTLRMIGGFEDPDDGRIELAGADVTHLPPHRRDVNTVFQSYALFPHLTVGENVAYGLRRKRVPRPEIRERVARILVLVDLEGFDGRRPSQLSGGQRQRVALARALVNRPRVLLLDEPLGALDLKLRKQMQLELKRIQDEVGITFVYVTHDQDEAMTMSDRLAVMRMGRIEQVGPPREVYERPRTEFVAAFLGASNLLDGTVTRRGEGDAEVRLASGETVRVPVDRLNGRTATVRVGVRPEKVRVLDASAPAAEGGNAIKGTIRMATFAGVSNEYTVDIDAGEPMRVYAQNVGDSGDPPRAAGDAVVLSWRPEHTFVIERLEEGATDG